jgi:hypothetical protein
VGDSRGCRKLQAASIFPLRPRSRDLADVVGLSNAPKPAARLVKRKSQSRDIGVPAYFSRGKKCDEAWNDDGKCERCLNGGLECHGQSEPVKRSRTTGPRQSSGSSAHATPTNGHLYQQPNSYQPSPHSFMSGHSPSVSNLRSTHADNTQIPTAGPSNYFTPSSFAPAYTIPTSTPLIDPIPDPSPFDWLKDGHSEPFAFLNTNFDVSSQVTSVPQQWNQSSFWDDFGSFLVPQSNMSPFDTTSTVPLESRLLFVPGATDNPMRRGVSLAEICMFLDSRTGADERRKSGRIMACRTTEYCSRLCKSENHGSE